MEAFEPIEQARVAKRQKDFPAAEKILRNALEVASEAEVREEIVRQLFYLYFSPAFEDLEKAQTCLTELEMLNPSAHNGMESALFWMNCKNDPVNAKKWFGITAVRAESENSIPTLYTATAFEGVLAAREANLSEVREVLGKLSSIVEVGQELPWGDEVPFLEASLNFGAGIRNQAKALAAKTGPRISDPQFRERAERVAREACQ